MQDDCGQNCIPAVKKDGFFVQNDPGGHVGQVRAIRRSRGLGKKKRKSPIRRIVFRFMFASTEKLCDPHSPFLHENADKTPRGKERCDATSPAVRQSPMEDYAHGVLPCGAIPFQAPQNHSPRVRLRIVHVSPSTEM